MNVQTNLIVSKIALHTEASSAADDGSLIHKKGSSVPPSRTNWSMAATRHGTLREPVGASCAPVILVTVSWMMLWSEAMAASYERGEGRAWPLIQCRMDLMPRSFQENMKLRILRCLSVQSIQETQQPIHVLFNIRVTVALRHRFKQAQSSRKARAAPFHVTRPAAISLAGPRRISTCV
jgi:hypothetical protein